MKRNLCNMCETCDNNEQSFLSCTDRCSVPSDILAEIEDARRTYEEAKNTIKTLQEHFVNNLFTNQPHAIHI